MSAPALTTPAPTTPGLPAVDTSPERLEALRAQLAATAPQVDETAEFPWEGLRAVHSAGLLTATAGGRHLSGVDAVRVFTALGAGDPSVALLAAMTVFLHPLAARTFPQRLLERLLRESAEGPTLLNAVRAEPELGAPARGGLPATTLRRAGTSGGDGLGWVLDGHKAYATGSEGLAYHLVWAVTDEPTPRVGHVVVPARRDDGTPTPGIEVVRTWDHLGMRATSTHDVVYSGVEVPLDHFAGAPVGTVPNNAAPVDALHLGLPALYLGVARAAQAAFTDFAHDRVPAALGRPIATTDRIRAVAGEVEAQLLGAEVILTSLARAVDESTPGSTDRQQALERSGVAKLLVTRAAITAVETLVGAAGNPGLSRRSPLQRHLRDVLCSRIHPPQDDTALIALGSRALTR
ncbi:Acyl-CoA dehydrogenase [Quadrisphaera granulorum]|uniref:Alkylation response protein AidB-like acyl-CoA dehydrogenase n=1 Tax=Quadrisphaera granulorum TaxID=317664 RepID=A0A315ZTU2_9ACTN|nr:acyl-CoA dehydrogenase family protein [Quadrisphaera granulorum]PWJ48308.1 alkylation response protein AidB-like acyl-CoA dehydrogenase [Quadrisphaera granulorum]SZE98469.1 Acyl-CoA dehydrogenase [Quadrisphaera granulorum]